MSYISPFFKGSCNVLQLPGYLRPGSGTCEQCSLRLGSKSSFSVNESKGLEERISFTDARRKVFVCVWFLSRFLARPTRLPRLRSTATILDRNQYGPIKERITLRQGFYLATFQLQENLLPVGLWLPQRKMSPRKSEVTSFNILYHKMCCLSTA